jgi:putative nucleotidyltransferase with HDIG domain
VNIATVYLTSLAQALAKMSLYTEGHPSRARAADASFDRLRELQRADTIPAFSFLGREVIYAQRTLRELADWDWAQRLSNAGVQRLEFQAEVSREEYHRFLEDLLSQLALTVGPRDRRHAVTPDRLHTPIRFGAVGVRGGTDVEEDEAMQAVLEEQERLDLSEEADVVEWMHDEVTAARQVPIAEAAAVVDSLTQAMHGSARAMIPLLSLKEFDQYTTTHALNVSVLAMGLASRLGLSNREVRNYGIAGLLHDLGKVNVPREVLRKPGALTPEEMAIMRGHTVEGARLILAADRKLDLCAVVAFEHHIMIDGGGYPDRCTRRDCHQASRLVHVCDVFDALRTHRPYRVAWDTASIIQYIERKIGTEFDPDITRTFLDMIRSAEVRLARAYSIDNDAAPASSDPSATASAVAPVAVAPVAAAPVAAGVG